jgi:hypothetical protein
MNLSSSFLFSKILCAAIIQMNLNIVYDTEERVFIIRKGEGRET